MSFVYLTFDATMNLTKNAATAFPTQNRKANFNLKTSLQQIDEADS